jgi:hypothetical protein
VAPPVVAEPVVAEPVVAEPVVAEPEPVIVPEPSTLAPEPVIAAEPEAAVDTPTEAPRLLLGDIGEALARELGLDLPAAPAPLPEPPATAVSPPAVEPRGTAWGADPNDEEPPRRGAFADYELPPSPFLVLRPHDH